MLIKTSKRSTTFILRSYASSASPTSLQFLCF